MFRAHRILVVLVTLRLLMPPGICACKLGSPVSRFVATFIQTGKLALPPLEREDAEDDDHTPGCPASFLASGMGVAPPVEPVLLTPLLSLDEPPVLTPAEAPAHATPEPTDALARAPDDPLYLTLCALVI